MSMHKEPLSPLEEMGLLAHFMGDSIGKPSMPADVFRSGIAWALMSEEDRIKNVQELLEHGLPVNELHQKRLHELLVTVKENNNE